MHRPAACLVLHIGCREAREITPVRGDERALPHAAILPGANPRCGHVEIALDILRIDAILREPLAREREDLFQQQLGGAGFASVEPRKARAEPLPRGRVEVGARRLER